VQGRSPQPIVSFEVRECHPGLRREIVSVAVTEEDYARLKAAGGPHPDQIGTALRYYLHAIGTTSTRRRIRDVGWARGPVMIFLCALPKQLLDQVRNLTGRFDTHTIEAVRLYMLECSDS